MTKEGDFNPHLFQINEGPTAENKKCVLLCGSIKRVLKLFDGFVIFDRWVDFRKSGLGLKVKAEGIWPRL